MWIFSNIVNQCRENEKRMFVYLLFFHIFVSVFLFITANTEYFSSLHNGEGLWNFAMDSTLYHKESLNSIVYLQNSEWQEWWQLYPNHRHVRLISFIYWITGYHIPIAYEIINSVVWAMSTLLIYRTSKLLFPDNNLAHLITIIFFFQPSILISSTQLLRDPILILGFCFICYGFAIFSKQKSIWRWALIIQVGIVLALSMREYLAVIIIIILLLPSIVLIKKKKYIPPFLFLLIPIILLEFFFQNIYISVNSVIKHGAKNQIQIPIVNQSIYIEQASTSATTEAVSETAAASYDSFDDKYLGTKSSDPTVDNDFATLVDGALYFNTTNNVMMVYDSGSTYCILGKGTWLSTAPTSFLTTISKNISSVRVGFRNVNLCNSDGGSRSHIDIYKEYNNFLDIVQYFPRALQIGLLSPFPSSWLEKGKQTGKIGRLLAGIEMVAWYIILLGFSYTVLKKPSAIKPLATVLLFSVTVIILLGYIVPNVGTIYRMRQAYMIPFFLFGSYGLHLMRSDFIKKII
jgi:hypothetical protein